MSNAEVLSLVQEQHSLVYITKQRQTNWTQHVLRHDCLLKTVLDREMEVKRTGEKPRTKMFDLLMEQDDKKISYHELKRRGEHWCAWHHHQLNLL